MKKLIILLLAILYFNCTFSELTTFIASDLGYYDLIVKLRLKVDQHLENIERSVNKILRNLNAQGKLVKAEVEREILDHIYERYVNAFDQIFQTNDRRVVVQGDEFDINNVSYEKKIQLITEAKKDIRNKINALIKESLDELRDKYNPMAL